MLTRSETAPLIPSNEPPPSYNAIINDHQAEPPRAASPPRFRRRTKGKFLCLYIVLGILAFVTLVLPLALLVSSARDIVFDPAARDRLHREWQREHNALEGERRTREKLHRQWEEEDQGREQRWQREDRARRAQWETDRREWDREMLKWRTEKRKEWERNDMRRHEQWKREDQERLDERRKWETEEREHEEEVKRWLEERARILGMLWIEPQAGDRCLGYGKREYIAQLDTATACKNAPVVIRDKTLMTYACVPDGGSVTGHFLVDFDEPACRPHWGPLDDKGCISWGPQGMRRVETRLMNIRSGDDWQLMCETTPATINGIEFQQPTRCEHRGMFHGMVGLFEYHDTGCR